MARKFDFIISNPPYRYELDVKLHSALQGCVADGGRMVFVHPAQFLLAHKIGVNKRVGRDIDLTSFSKVNLFWGNWLFGIQLFGPLAITQWDMGHSGGIEVVDDAYTHSTYKCSAEQVSPYGTLYPRLLEWVALGVNCQDTIAKGHSSDEATTDYAIVLPQIRGRPPRPTEQGCHDSFLTILPKEQEYMDARLVKRGYVDETGRKNRLKCVYSFNSIQERDNFIVYLKTKCVRFILSIFKVNQSIFAGEMNQIPWMDFTRPHYDSDLIHMWKVDESLWKFIDTTIPDYYEDYSFSRPPLQQGSDLL